MYTKILEEDRKGDKSSKMYLSMSHMAPLLCRVEYDIKSENISLLNI